MGTVIVTWTLNQMILWYLTTPARIQVCGKSSTSAFQTQKTDIKHPESIIRFGGLGRPEGGAVDGKTMGRSDVWSLGCTELTKMMLVIKRTNRWKSDRVVELLGKLLEEGFRG